MNRKTLSGYGDMAGWGASIIALLLAAHVVCGKKWIQAHNYLGMTAVVLFLISRA
jgi:hypothetical protein